MRPGQRVLSILALAFLTGCPFAMNDDFFVVDAAAPAVAEPVPPPTSPPAMPPPETPPQEPPKEGGKDGGCQGKGCHGGQD